MGLGDPPDLEEGAGVGAAREPATGRRSILELDLDVGAVAHRGGPDDRADRLGGAAPLADDPAHVGRAGAHLEAGQVAPLADVDAHGVGVVDQRGDR